jgi:type IV pilus biogenesis protein PilP
MIYDGMIFMRDRAFTAGWLVGAVLLSTWAMSSASDRPAAPAPGPQAAAPALPRVSADLAAQIANLEARTTARAAPIEGRRNPFTFDDPGSTFKVRGSRFEKPPAPVSPSNIELGTANFEPRTSNSPAPSLAALATVSGALTAVISFDGTLHYVKTGDLIAGRYRVDSVTADAVDVFDLAVGTILRLTLRTMT